MKLKNNYNIPANDIDQITENIYIGNLKGAENLGKIIELGITKVVSVMGERTAPSYPKNIQQKIIPIFDIPSANVLKYLQQCLYFMDGDEKVLVHCYKGASRSATFVIAYLMWKNKISLLRAFKYVHAKRPIVEPNYGFLMQLSKFERKLKYNKYNISGEDFSSVNYDTSESGGCCHA